MNEWMNVCGKWGMGDGGRGKGCVGGWLGLLALQSSDSELGVRWKCLCFTSLSQSQCGSVGMDGDLIGFVLRGEGDEVIIIVVLISGLSIFSANAVL